jgi:hypothetical protein
MDFRQAGWEGMDWVDLIQDGYEWWAIVNVVENFGSCTRQRYSCLVE